MLTRTRNLAVFKSLEVICIALTSAISETFTLMSPWVVKKPRNRRLTGSSLKRKIATS